MGLRELYRGVQRKAVREETYLIKGLLLDAEKAENAQAFQKLGLKALLTRLKTINDAYEAKTASRAESQLAKMLYLQQRSFVSSWISIMKPLPSR